MTGNGNEPSDQEPAVEEPSAEALIQTAAELRELMERLEQQATRIERLTDDQAGEIERRAYRRLWRPIALVLAVLGTGFGISAWRALIYIDRQIEDQFAKPRVEATLIRVAEGRAAELLNERVTPAVENAKKFIEEEKVVLRKAAATIRKDFQGQLDELETHVEYQNALREIQRLQDEAVTGHVRAFEQLEQFETSDPELRARLQGALVMARTQYSGVTKSRNFSFQAKTADGTEISEGELSLSSLIEGLADGPHSSIRTRAAYLLGSRRERGVIEALERAIDTDPNMWVRVEALRAYRKIIGYRAKHTFDFDGAKAHYRDKKEELDAKLGEPKGEQPVEIW